MVKIIRDSSNRERISDAATALLGFAPSLDKRSISEIIWEMAKIIRDSQNERRRSVVQKVLVTVKNLELTKESMF
jgi:hypothetical protein